MHYGSTCTWWMASDEDRQLGRFNSGSQSDGGTRKSWFRSGNWWVWSRDVKSHFLMIPKAVLTYMKGVLFPIEKVLLLLGVLVYLKGIHRVKEVGDTLQAEVMNLEVINRLVEEATVEVSREVVFMEETAFRMANLEGLQLEQVFRWVEVVFLEVDLAFPVELLEVFFLEEGLDFLGDHLVEAFREVILEEEEPGCRLEMCRRGWVV